MSPAPTGVSGVTMNSIGGSGWVLDSTVKMRARMMVPGIVAAT